MKKVKLKPYKTVQLAYMLWGIMLVGICIEIVSIVFSKDMNEFLMGNLVLLGVIIICIVAYLCTRLFYRSYLVITDQEIVKYNGKKVIYRIKRSEIHAISYRRMLWYMWLALPLLSFIGNAMFGIFFLKYKNAEIETFPNIYDPESLTETEKAEGIKEYAELLTKKEADRIGNVLKLQVAEAGTFRA